jgi:uncharacterized protein
MINGRLQDGYGDESMRPNLPTLMDGMRVETIAPRLGPRWRIVAFVLITFGLSWTYLWTGITRLQMPVWVVSWSLMWIPAVVSIGFRFALREGFCDAGFRIGRVNDWLIACLVPFGLASATYLLAWLLGIVHITPYLRQQSMFGPTPLRLFWIYPDATTFLLLGQRLAMVLTLGLTQGFFSGLGEEIGWRGYLLPRLIKAKLRFPILVSGIIWGIWHVPFVLLTFQHKPYIVSVIYVLLCVVVAVFVGWVRLTSGSVLVAGMAHGAYNTFYQDLFDHSFAGEHKWFWAGEVGLFCSLAFGAFAFWLYKTNRIAPLIAQHERGCICVR